MRGLQILLSDNREIEVIQPATIVSRLICAVILQRQDIILTALLAL